MSKDPLGRGRPTIKTPELLAEIINYIASGGWLSAYCRQEGAPSWATVHAWLNEDKEFSGRMADAVVIGSNAIGEECIKIADTPQLGTIETTEVDLAGRVMHKRVTEDMLAHRNLQISTRLKVLAKRCPKKWGDKQQVEHSAGVQITLDTGIRRAVPGDEPAS